MIDPKRPCSELFGFCSEKILFRVVIFPTRKHWKLLYRMIILAMQILIICRRETNHVCLFLFSPGTTNCSNDDDALSCSHLCLASPTGYKCACPGSTRLGDNNRTCECPNGRIATLGPDFCPPCPLGEFTCGSKCLPEEYDYS